MILAKVYKTLAGCDKYCRFYNGLERGKCIEEHANWTWTPVRFVDGVRDVGQFDPTISKAKRYTWRVEKEKRRKA